MAFTKTAGADRGGRRSKRDLVGQSHRAGWRFNLTARFCCRFAADAVTPDGHTTVCCAWLQLRTPSCGIYRPGRPPYIRVPGSGAGADPCRAPPPRSMSTVYIPTVTRRSRPLRSRRANEGAGHPGRLSIGDAAPVRVTVHRPSARARSLTTKMHCSNSAVMTLFQGILASRNCQCFPARASAKRPHLGISI